MEVNYISDHKTVLRRLAQKNCCNLLGDDHPFSSTKNRLNLKTKNLETDFDPFELNTCRTHLVICSLVQRI